MIQPTAPAEAALQLSRYWPSQAEARAIVAGCGCKVCGWKYPGQIWDVSGDLWCQHCVREQGAEIPDLVVLLIPD